MSATELISRTVSRRSALAAGGTAVGALALATCGPQPIGGGGGGSESQGVALEKRKATTIELWSDPADDGRKDQVAAWNQKYPNLKVNYGSIKTTGQGVESFAPIIAAAAAGTPPQVVDFDRFQVAAMVVKKVWMSLEDFIKRDKYDLNRFAPLIVPEAKGPDGKWYALIRSTDDRLLYWNKDAFQEVGLDPEKPPATWDEFKQMAIRLTKRGGPNGFERIGFHTEEGQSHYHIFAWQNGGSFQSQDGKKGTLTLAPNQEALQWMTDLMKDLGGWGPLKDFRGTWGKDAQNAFLVGQLAMQYQTNNWPGGNVAKYRPEMKFGVAQPPVKKSGDKPLTWSGGHSFCLSNGAKDADVGWELAKWLISEEGQTALNDGNLARAKAIGGVYLPTMTAQTELDKKMFAKYKTGIPAVDKVPELAVQLMQYSRVREPSIAAQSLWDAVKNSQTQAISQEKSAKQALEDNQVIYQKDLDEAWANAPK